MGPLVRSALNWFVISETVLSGMTVTALIGGNSTMLKPVMGFVVVLLAGVLPIIAAVIATRNPRLAYQLLLPISPLALLIALMNPFFLYGGYLASFSVLSGATVLPALFWWFTLRRGWAVPVRSKLPSIMIFAAGFTLVVLFVTISLALSFFLPWWSPIGDCGGRPLLQDDGVPKNNLFTARILFVAPKTPYFNYSLWSLARVEHDYSKVRMGPFRLIILRNFFDKSDEGETYFVEGVDSGEGLNRFLPVIERAECGRTSPLRYAEVAVRIIRDGRPLNGARLIGCIYGGSDWKSRVPLPNTKITIRGPAGSTITTTDSQGVYQWDGLAPGQYVVSVETGGDKASTILRKTDDITVQPREIAELSIYVH